MHDVAHDSECIVAALLSRSALLTLRFFVAKEAHLLYEIAFRNRLLSHAVSDNLQLGHVACLSRTFSMPIDIYTAIRTAGIQLSCDTQCIIM